jgi:hypothetical protein
MTGINCTTANTRLAASLIVLASPINKNEFVVRLSRKSSLFWRPAASRWTLAVTYRHFLFK